MQSLTNKKLTITRHGTNDILIDYNPQKPPQVFFDTHVLIGLNPRGIAALENLKNKKGFTYRYSMLNFLELASHLGDEPSANVLSPFTKFQMVFKKVTKLFHLNPLPSPESIFMKAVGLHPYLEPSWEVKEGWVETIKFISEATTLEELHKAGFSSKHYKDLRKNDKKWFLRFIEKARCLGAFPQITQDISPEWGNFLGQFYEFLICRASNERISFSALEREGKMRVLDFFGSITLVGEFF